MFNLHFLHDNAEFSNFADTKQDNNKNSSIYGTDGTNNPARQGEQAAYCAP